MKPEQVRYLGFDALRLANTQLEVVVVPALGGRIMSLKFEDHEFLFTNPALHGKLFSFAEHAAGTSLLDWKNYGGDKTWPAPQGWERSDQWPGPPDPYLDSGLYQAACHEDGVTLTSPADPRSGLQIERTISLASDAARLTLAITFTNRSRRDVRWAIWNVTQLDCSKDADYWLYMAADPKHEPQILFGDQNPDYLKQLHPQILRGVLGVNYQGQVGKVGTSSSENWLVFSDSRHVLGMRSAYRAQAEYPDDGCSLECWTESPGAPSPVPLASPGKILEAEVLGPLMRLAPEASTSLQIDYQATSIPEPTVHGQAIPSKEQLADTVMNLFASGGGLQFR